jgi:inositol-phosphate phosphatase/L-galactose 1-phosphate phosphatase
MPLHSRRCDPLDGTTNFVHSFPFVCVSIGLVIKKQVVVGVVHNPILNETFSGDSHQGVGKAKGWSGEDSTYFLVTDAPSACSISAAVRGGGAKLNDQTISVSKTSQMGNALVCTEIGTTRDEETVSAIFRRWEGGRNLCKRNREGNLGARKKKGLVMKWDEDKVNGWLAVLKLHLSICCCCRACRMRAVAEAAQSTRCCGSCACNMTSVACGRLDAFYEIGFGGCWDVAAGR